ncbi:MAG: methyltransferase domain-containing protein, partial [Candidatus Bathyarchaeota archaeon]|nr:methyltransferase domain-containing protein [Candidatus Bathyarchaeota archaeon]
MLSEKLLYSFFGNNIIIGEHIQEQLKFLKRFLPEEFKGKEMHDLGCGDGKVTILLEDIFKPKQCSGYDVNQNLVRLARRRGVQASNLDLEKVIPGGELAVVWGVLHHLRSPSKFLK